MLQHFFSRLVGSLEQILTEELPAMLCGDICLRCRGELLLRERLICRQCLADLALDHTCFAPPPRALFACSALLMEPAIREMLHFLKYRGFTRLSADLTPHLEESLVRVRQWAPELLLPVPLAPVRRRERGYNQAELLAARLEELLGVSSAPSVVRRVRWEGSQTRLGVEARRRNLRGAFQCVAPEVIRGRRVLVVDDVFTTGATSGELLRVLPPGEYAVWTLAYRPLRE